MAPATLRSSAVTAFPSRVVARTIRPRRRRRSCEVAREGEDGHDLRGDGDDELGLARVAVLAAAQAHHDLPERPVADVQRARPEDVQAVDAERIPVMDVVVHERGTEVVGRPDRVDVAGQVEVEVLHRDDLALPAAGRAALDPEDRTQARLAEADRRLPADQVQALGEAHGGGALALAEGRRADRGHEDVLAARALGLEPLDRREADLRLREAVRLDLVVPQPEVAGDLQDGARGDRTGDLQV